MTTVTIEKVRTSQARVLIAGVAMGAGAVVALEARFEKARKGWIVTTPAGELYSKSANLARIGHLFGAGKAMIAGAAIAELPPAICLEDPSVVRQVRRILASMEAFPFESYWKSHNERHGCETGHTHRVAGDPIFHTIGQVAGVDCTRAETSEAIAALLEARRPNLPPRMQGLPEAVKLVAEALAQGRPSVIRPEGDRVKIEGPNLPNNFDDLDPIPF